MHELSIALGIVDAAAEEARRHNAGRIAAVHLTLGPLAGVIKEALISAYELAAEGSPVAGSRLVVKDSPLIIRCPACKAERPARSILDMRCEACGTPSAEVVSGRELMVTALEIEE